MTDTDATTVTGSSDSSDAAEEQTTSDTVETTDPAGTDGNTPSAKGMTNGGANTDSGWSKVQRPR